MSVYFPAVRLGPAITYKLIICFENSTSKKQTQSWKTLENLFFKFKVRESMRNESIKAARNDESTHVGVQCPVGGAMDMR